MAAPVPTRPRAGRVTTIVVLGLVALVVVGGPLVLHFGQIRHDRLDWDVQARFPMDHPLVGGEAFASTLIAIMEHELQSATGWRPNDFVLWGPRLWADNNANRQIGIIQAVRESVRVLKDHLTKVSSDEYDPHLVRADVLFRNDERRLWFPSAESRYRDAVAELRAYVDGLATTPPHSKRLNQRNIELMRLFQAWMDLLGDAHGTLYRDPASWTTSDDDFYVAQGRAHVMAHLMPAVWREYHEDLAGRPVMPTLFEEVTAALQQAAVLKPLVVMNGGPTSIFANHRRNLDTYVTEARQKMYSIREELEK